MILAPDGQKMSKSKGNTIEPGSLIDQGYGADAIRIMELFIGPWNQEANWSVEGMGGCFRFLQRIWTLTQEYLEAKSEDETNDSDQAIRRITHKTIKKVSEDLHDMGFNTAIAALMELTNQLYKLKAQHGFAAHDAWQFALESTLQLLAPFAPHMTDELWQQLGHAESIHTTTWPMWDDQYLAVDSVTIVVQINGKVRAQITMPTGSEKETTLQAAKADPKVATHLTNKPIKKEIYIPGRLVSFVI
jgi:leucyl-tRNA synthetase